jgi:RHS repeat-associated protein
LWLILLGAAAWTLVVAWLVNPSFIGNFMHLRRFAAEHREFLAEFPRSELSRQEAAQAIDRFYNPLDGRFLTMDTARNGGDLRATLSLYGYCEGDPINRTDTTGLWSMTRHKTVTKYAARRAGFSNDHSKVMGNGARNLDVFAPAFPFPRFHFNMTAFDGQLSLWTKRPWTNASFTAGKRDSRVQYFNICQANAKAMWKLGLKRGAVHNFGLGLHSIQDIYAHGNIRPFQHQYLWKDRKKWDNKNQKSWRWKNAVKKTQELTRDFHNWTKKN